MLIISRPWNTLHVNLAFSCLHSIPMRPHKESRSPAHHYLKNCSALCYIFDPGAGATHMLWPLPLTKLRQDDQSYVTRRCVGFPLCQRRCCSSCDSLVSAVSTLHDDNFISRRIPLGVSEWVQLWFRVQSNLTLVTYSLFPVFPLAADFQFAELHYIWQQYFVSLLLYTFTSHSRYNPALV